MEPLIRRGFSLDDQVIPRAAGSLSAQIAQALASINVAGSQSDACDLTQQTFYVWARKGHQLRDPSKVKQWLFTTLHREFLESRRRTTRFPHHELGQVGDELPPSLPNAVERADAAMVLECLGQIDEQHRAPLALFYLEVGEMEVEAH